jgi:hypothetical protein
VANPVGRPGETRDDMGVVFPRHRRISKAVLPVRCGNTAFLNPASRPKRWLILDQGMRKPTESGLEEDCGFSVCFLQDRNAVFCDIQSAFVNNSGKQILVLALRKPDLFFTISVIKVKTIDPALLRAGH